jgi:glutamyl-tRNA synthetase
LIESRRILVGRLAPSPTGGLHLGHARSFLLAWLSARSSSGGGRVVLRVEDLDASRARPEAVGQAVEGLRWLGLDWDEGPDVGGPAGPYLQSLRFDNYRAALDRLIAEDRVFPCTCTRADLLRAAASAPHAEDEGPTYPGTCAHRSAGDAARFPGDRPFAWRFRVEPGPIAWNDLIAGPVTVDPSISGGSFLVARRPEAFGYQLAVVCDDAAMGVTQVIRGDDLTPSTPRQMLLYQALGWPAPRFGHVPLVLGPDGRRLAKRDGAVKLATYRARGIDPRSLIGLLAVSLGLDDVVRPTWPSDRLDRFDLAKVPRAPWVVPEDLEDALKLNGSRSPGGP